MLTVSHFAVSLRCESFRRILVGDILNVSERILLIIPEISDCDKVVCTRADAQFNCASVDSQFSALESICSLLCTGVDVHFGVLGLIAAQCT